MLLSAKRLLWAMTDKSLSILPLIALRVCFHKLETRLSGTVTFSRLRIMQAKVAAGARVRYSVFWRSHIARSC